MAYWQYLTTQAYSARLVLAASYVKDCSSIIEIGGFNMPISSFLTHAYDKVINIDPLIEPLQEDKILHVPIDYRDFDFAPFLHKEYALVMMGMEVPYSQKLHELICHAKKVVIDFPSKHLRSTDLLKEILLRADLKKQIHIRMDFSDTPLEQDSDSYPPYPSREFLVYTSK